jgi:ribosome biogenesis protein Tsr3
MFGASKQTSPIRLKAAFIAGASVIKCQTTHIAAVITIVIVVAVKAVIVVVFNALAILAHRFVPFMVAHNPHTLA